MRIRSSRSPKAGSSHSIIEHSKMKLPDCIRAGCPNPPDELPASRELDSTVILDAGPGLGPTLDLGRQNIGIRVWPVGTAAVGIGPAVRAPFHMSTDSVHVVLPHAECTESFVLRSRHPAAGMAPEAPDNDSPGSSAAPPRERGRSEAILRHPGGVSPPSRFSIRASRFPTRQSHSLHDPTARTRGADRGIPRNVLLLDRQQQADSVKRTLGRHLQGEQE